MGYTFPSSEQVNLESQGKKSEVASMKDIEDNSSTCPAEQLLDTFFNLLPLFSLYPFKPEIPLRTAFSLQSGWEVSCSAPRVSAEVSSDKEDAGVLQGSSLPTF